MVAGASAAALARRANSRPVPCATARGAAAKRRCPPIPRLNGRHSGRPVSRRTRCAGQSPACRTAAGRAPRGRTHGPLSAKATSTPPSTRERRKGTSQESRSNLATGKVSLVSRHRCNAFCSSGRAAFLPGSTSTNIGAISRSAGLRKASIAACCASRPTLAGPACQWIPGNRPHEPAPPWHLSRWLSPFQSGLGMESTAPSFDGAMLLHVRAKNDPSVGCRCIASQKGGDFVVIISRSRRIPLA